jgi:sodium-dependent phosphate cotransporter
LLKLKSAAVPFILGANIGTTITAFIAALFNSNAAISVAIAHFLFNAIGVILFYLMPVVKELPGKTGRWIWEGSRSNIRLAGFLIPCSLLFAWFRFSLIYFNKDAVRNT